MSQNGIHTAELAYHLQLLCGFRHSLQVLTRGRIPQPLQIVTDLLEDLADAHPDLLPELTPHHFAGVLQPVVNLSVGSVFHTEPLSKPLAAVLVIRRPWVFRPRSAFSVSIDALHGAAEIVPTVIFAGMVALDSRE